MAQCSIDDKIFMDLKNYSKYPEREKIGWMSNNSVVLSKSEDFQKIPDIVENIYLNGEPGIINKINISKYGKFGKVIDDKNSTILNPCGEINLASNEVCNLVTTCPTKCENFNEWYNILELATIYAMNTSLCPTCIPETNEIIAKNRRIGISISGIAEITSKIHFSEFIRVLRNGYDKVRQTNKDYSQLIGIKESIKVTTIKPDGSLSLLINTTPGVHFPIGKYMIRRVRMNKDLELAKVLVESKLVKFEDDAYDKTMYCFEFLVKYDNISRFSKDIDIWEQFNYLSTMQREWADNSISNTLYFDPHKIEKKTLENVISMNIPTLKSITLLPSSTKTYKQMPFEEISKEEYEKREKDMNITELLKILNKKMRCESEPEKGCDGLKCNI